MYSNEYETKGENRNMTIESWYFLESKFAVGVYRLFVLVFSNQDNKRYKAKRF